MGIKLANNAFGTLAAGIASGATSITLTTGHGDRFPFLGAGDYFYATLIDTSNNLEIVKCTAMSTDVLTVTRAQEGTTARAYSAGDRIEIRLTAQTFSDVVDVTALAKKDGSNATGTWPVSVSGNAATATNAEKLGGESYTAYVRSVNGTTPGADGNVAVRRGAAIYTSSGTFTVPTGVTSVKVRGCGGGSGGGGGFTPPGAGGTTSFGSHCSATGGIGATPGTGTGGDINLAGGYGGRTGSGSVNTAGGGAVGGGCGGGGSGSGAAPTGLLGGSGYYAAAATGYGNGGGASNEGSTTSRSAGSAGGYFEKYITNLTPRSSITVTIGAAGTAGDGGVAGAPGICIVEW